MQDMLTLCFAGGAVSTLVTILLVLAGTQGWARIPGRTPPGTGAVLPDVELGGWVVDGQELRHVTGLRLADSGNVFIGKLHVGRAPVGYRDEVLTLLIEEGSTQALLEPVARTSLLVESRREMPVTAIGHLIDSAYVEAAMNHPRARDESIRLNVEDAKQFQIGDVLEVTVRRIRR